MASASDRKIAEGLDHLRLAEKYLKTSLFKWKPDYDSAVDEYGKAAVAFKNARAYEQATTTYLKCADVQKQMGSAFHAAKSMEAAALIYRDMKETDRACSLVEDASLLYLEHGVPDTAVLALERAAKMVERDSPDRAIKLYERAFDVSEGEDNIRQCAEMIGKAARLLMRLRRLDDAVEALQKEIDCYAQVENHGMLNKIVFGLVLCHLHREDYVAADQAFQKTLRYEGFLESEEAGAMQRLLDAYDEGDQDVADEVLTSPLFRFMENDFTKLARDLRVPGGRKKKVSSPTGDGGEVEEEEEEFDLK